MNSKVLAAAFLPAFTVAAAAQMPDPPITRPKITGISHLAVYTSDPAAADHYYREIIGAAKLPDPENPKGVRYAFNATQFIEVLPLPPARESTGWTTPPITPTTPRALRKYLAAKAWKTPAKVEKGSDGSRWFTVLDPEGNKVEFVEPPALPKAVVAPNAIGRHIIHVGIHGAQPRRRRHLLSRSARLPPLLVWRHGGGQDRLGEPADPRQPRLAGIHADHDPSGYRLPQHDLGVLDHFSIGVDSVDAAYKTLKDAAAWLDVRRTRGTRRWPGRQGPVQPLRSGWHPPGTDELPRHRKALLLALHRRGSGGVALLSDLDTACGAFRDF